MATEGNMGGSYGWFYGKVVNRDDPLKSGRVQIRVFGIHDDKSNVPDKDLPWMYPEGTVHSASLNHVGVSPTGVQVGSTVRGYWTDRDKTIGVWSGSIARAQIKDDNSGLQNDVAHNARGTQKTGAQGETNLGKDFNTIIQKNHIEHAEQDDKAEFPTAKFKDLATIASMAFQDGQKVLSLVKQLDPSNLTGAIKPALDGMIGLKNLTAAGGLVSMAGGQLQQILGQVQGQTTSQISGQVQQLMDNPAVSDFKKLASQAGNLQNILQSIMGQFMGAGGPTGGIGSFDMMMGKVKMMEKYFEQIKAGVK